MSAKKILANILTLAIGAAAGVTNPDLSVIGQVLGSWTDDPASPDKDRATLHLGEVELVADAPLNPYAKGVVVLTASETGASVEEAYASLDGLLPAGLAIKAGKYRAPFGKINPTHPHALPFVDPPRLLRPETGLIPGDESWNETALQLSELFPGAGSWAPQVSVDVEEGKGWRDGQNSDSAAADWDPRHDETHLAWMGHFSNGFSWGDWLAGDAGLSLGTGTTNVAAGTRATVAGADLKLKFFLDGRTRLLLQGEWLRRWSRDAAWNVSTDTYTKADVDRQGACGFFDLARDRWDGGVLYEAYDSRTGGIDQAAKVFAGFGLMEETTLFRLTFEHFVPHAGPSVNTVGGQLLFSMGPHKPHSF